MSPNNASLFLRHGRVIDPGRIDGPADVLVQDGKIAAIGLDLSVPAGIEIAATREGVSVNTWIVRALSRVSSAAPATQSGNRLTGYARS